MGISLNPGPFSIKEHVIITIMAGVGYGSAYAVSPLLSTFDLVPFFVVCIDDRNDPSQTDIVAVQRVYYHQTYSFSYQWVLVMSTQLIGFSIGGIAKRFLVAPPSMSEFIGSSLFLFFFL
jgi:hypothetical protein